MLLDKKMEDALHYLKFMSKSQLSEMVNAAQLQIDKRDKEFMELCTTLVEVLFKLHLNYPNSNIYLTKDYDEKINIMDYILPKDFLERCDINE